MRSRFASMVLALGTLCVLATGAFGQDYTVTNVNGKWVEPPGNATVLPLSSHSTTNITLPFQFPFFGNTYTAARVGDEGWMQIGPTNPMPSTAARQFPNNSYDGLVCPAWHYHLHASNGDVTTFQTGAAPNRVFHVTWNQTGSYNINMQIQLHETSGRIIFAYKAGGNWTSRSHYEGMQAPDLNDQRFMLTDGLNTAKRVMPSSDFQFDPVKTNFTGRLLMDRPSADVNGIGDSTLFGRPVGGARVELVHSGSGGVVGSGVTAADGTFTVSGLALNSDESGTLRVTTEGDAAIVTTDANGSPLSLDLGVTVDFDQSADVGTLRITEGMDADARVRSRLNVLTAIRSVYEVASSLTTDTIPRLAVYYDPASTTGTTYTPDSGAVPATLRVGGDLSPNPDQWDDDVIGRIYGVHVFDAVVGDASTAYDLGWDATTNDANALAVGLGYYLRALADGNAEIVDATGPSSGTVRDLDVDAPTADRGPTVAGWVAMGFYDTLDTADEPHDLLDGTVDQPGRIFAAVDALGTTLTCSSVFDAFIAQGGDGGALATNFIHHRLIPDDDEEANDSLDDATYAGIAGIRLDSRVLTAFNEDWYRVTIPDATDGVFTTLSFNRSEFDAAVFVDVLDTNGNPLASGSASTPVSEFRAQTPAFGPGDLYVRVGHVGGPSVPDYRLQVFSRMVASVVPIPAWTRSLPFESDLVVTGGIEPYEFVVDVNSELPDGLVLDAERGRLGGAPSIAGGHDYIVVVTDDGIPVNERSIELSLDVNELLAFETPPFTGVSLDAPTDVSLARVGGTDPIALSDLDNGMPPGLTLDPDFRFRGVPTALGDGRLSFRATDVAGAESTVDTGVVVCGPIPGKKAPLDLAAASAAGGFHFDALRGSIASFKMKTAKKRAKRTFAATLVGPDGREVFAGAAKIKRGAMTLKKIPLETTGRYYVILSGDDGDATQVLGSLKVALPKKGAGEATHLDEGERVEIPFGAVDGTRFTLKGKVTDDMELIVLVLLEPDGTILPASDIKVTTKGAKLSIDVTLRKAGTHTLILTPKPGALGSVAYKYKLKHPKGAAFAPAD